jgi:hypothetical protein
MQSRGPLRWLFDQRRFVRPSEKRRDEGRQFVRREAPVQHACCASTKGGAKKKEAAI